MPVLKWIGWACIAASGLVAMFALSEESIMLVAAAVSGAVTGVVLLALERIVSAVENIRDDLRRETNADVPPADADDLRPVASMTEIEAGIAAAKRRAAAN